MLLAAQQTHGPPHGLVVAIIAVAIVGWLVYRAVAARRSSGNDQAASDRGTTMTESPVRAPDRDRVPEP